MGDGKSIRTSPLSDGSVVGGPGLRVTLQHSRQPSRLGAKVLGSVAQRSHGPTLAWELDGWTLPFAIHLLKAKLPNGHNALSSRSL